MTETKQQITSEALRGLSVLLRYFISSALWQLLNPRGIAQSLLQMGGQVVGQVRWLLYHKVIQPIPMGLPFNDKWLVFNGGVDKANSHSWSLIAQRYAYDFVISNANGKNYTDSGMCVQNYLCWEKDILSPADGVVIRVRNDIHDSPHVSGWLDIFTPDIRGNHVVIQHAPSVFSLMAHLQHGSIPLKPGDAVKRGQPIGLCGNSGHSTEPHLHFQVQDHPNFYVAVGLPILFDNVEMQDPATKTIEYIARGYIRKDRKIASLPQWIEGTTSTTLLQPQLSWAELIISLITAALVLMGLLSIAARIINLFV